MCGENHEYHELHPLNKCLSVQHNIVNSRYNVAWQIFKAYSSCLTETLCPLMSYISSLPLGPGNHHSTLILQFWLCLHASRLNASVRVCVHSVAQSCLTLQYYGLQPARLPCPWDFPGKNTGVGYCALLQGIFLTQGSNLCLLCLSCIGRWVLYH